MRGFERSDGSFEKGARSFLEAFLTCIHHDVEYKCMNRTQIYLPHSQRMALKREAQTRNTTLSAIIRTILQDKLLTLCQKKATKK